MLVHISPSLLRREVGMGKCCKYAHENGCSTYLLFKSQSQLVILPIDTTILYIRIASAVVVPNRKILQYNSNLPYTLHYSLASKKKHYQGNTFVRLHIFLPYQNSEDRRGFYNGKQGTRWVVRITIISLVSKRGFYNGKSRFFSHVRISKFLHGPVFDSRQFRLNQKYEK